MTPAMIGWLTIRFVRRTRFVDRARQRNARAGTPDASMSEKLAMLPAAQAR